MPETLEQLKNLGKYYKKETRPLFVSVDGMRVPVEEILANIPSFIIVPEDENRDLLRTSQEFVLNK